MRSAPTWRKGGRRFASGAARRKPPSSFPPGWCSPPSRYIFAIIVCTCIMYFSVTHQNTKDRKMLKSWSIKNFKPIVDSGELQLAPVTVFAGRNSSGKSSLLQSILMISQTLGSRLLDRPLLPNERLVQLGTFEDILSEIIHSRILELGVGLEMESEEIKTPSRLRGNTRLDIKSAKFLVRFNSASANGTSSSAIEAAKVVVENVLVTAQAERITAERLIPSEAPQQLTFEELMDPHQISFSLKKATNQDIQHFLRNVPQEYSQIFSLTNN